jgi:DNA-binding CsgD family transcriptional regulator
MLSAIMLDIVKQTALLDALTDKQREVLALVSEGMTSKEIARKLGISESAVNQRIEVVRQRLDGMSRAQIARTYRRTSTLVLTIPTSNSLTGKSNQLLSDNEAEQHSSSEGVEDTVVSSGGEFGVLQPSTLPPVFHGRDAKLARTAAVVVIAVGIVALVVLVLVAGRTLAEIVPR